MFVFNKFKHKLKIKKMKTRLIVFFVCLIHVSIAQDSLVIKYSNTITREELLYHLTILASDEYEGRDTGEKGQKMAAIYISQEFANDMLTGPVSGRGNPYYQEFELARKSWEKINIGNSDVRLEYLKDFFVIGNLKPGNEAYEIIFAGYGIDEKNYSDYNNIDVKGKIVAVLMGEPRDEAGNYIITGTDKPSIPDDNNIQNKILQFQFKIQLASEKGAAGIVIIEKDDATANSMIQMVGPFLNRPQIGFPENKKNETFGVIYTSPSQAVNLLGTKIRKFNKTIDTIGKKKKSAAGKFKGIIKIEALQKIEKFTTENILGFVEGTDKKDEIIVITAHYDHIGIMGGEVYNGADDNGSGIVSVLEIAEAFIKAKEEGNGPRRSLLFMTVTAEEIGLFGSFYYSENPVFPLESTVANLNIDMIGRIDLVHQGNPDYVYIIGSDMLSSELHKLSEKAAQIYTPSLQLDYTHNSIDDPERWYFRSDQYNFAKHDIPVICYTTGEHEDYHKPADTVDKINFGKIEMISRLIFATAWELANREERIVVDKK